MKEPEENPGKAGEPQPDYGKRIIFFNSFEEMNEYDAKENAAINPLQHLQNVTQFIKL